MPVFKPIPRKQHHLDGTTASIRRFASNPTRKWSPSFSTPQQE